MTWQTPTFADVRRLARDYVNGKLPGADAGAPNTRLRVLSDSNAALAHLTLQYIDWLSDQLLPDTAESEWLDRHGRIWLGGRKTPTFAGGLVAITGVEGTIVPEATRLASGSVEYETLDPITLGPGATEAPVRALTAGTAGNRDPGDVLSLSEPPPLIDGQALVVAMTGGADAEKDDDLRARVLARIRMPPMGGAAHDYVQWALEIPGVTRAWCSPIEMGMGTVTVRFMMDELRASTGGFPTADDIAYVAEQLDAVRPVAVMDFFVLSPIAEPINFALDSLNPDTSAIRAAITANVAAMLRDRARPAYSLNGISQDAQTIYSEWVSAAIYATPGVDNFDLDMVDHVMPSPGHMAVPGTITWPA
ncbi:baseplate J/gp47 family protein [Chelatococcus reniformis]|uniref:Tail protein n=1 Tax=Chelatococcus reniformis TaxID=1494448 RepID=A0A916UGF0_9HYPH|nr:baseplate J/gp47 family protein [Chelatococcus reniformis]GGC70919.1 tail protein [Chelatococcus reniformis]